MSASRGTRLLKDHWLWVSALLGVCILALAVHSESASASASAKASASTPLTKVTFLTPRAASTAPVVIGARRLGFFKQEGIDLQINFDVPSAQQIPNLVAGNAQFVAAGWGTLINAAITKLPIVGIAGLTVGGTTVRNDDVLLLSLANGPIKTLNDLRGKTIAVAILGAQPEVMMRYTLFKKAGLRSQDFSVAQLAYPDMGPALRAGRVDAIVAVEPFTAMNSAIAPLRRLAPVLANIVPGLPGGNIATSRSYLSSNKRIVDGFRRATARSLRWATRNPEKFYAYLPTFLKIDKSVVDNMNKPNFSTEVDFKKLSRYITIAHNLGKIESKPKPETFAVLK